MTWEQKFQAIQALAPFGPHQVVLNMRTPCDWYISGPMEIEDKHTLCSIGYAGRTPEAAVENAWAKMAAYGAMVRVGGISSGHKSYTWNGFMWKEVTK